jgi:hypothetical protein
VTNKDSSQAIQSGKAVDPRYVEASPYHTIHSNHILTLGCFHISQGESVDMITVIGCICFALSGTIAIVAKHIGLFTGVASIYLDVVYNSMAFTILFMVSYWSCGGGHNLHLTRLDAHILP